MSGPLIFAHVDVDGITSARIALHTEMYRDAKVLFTPYTKFGVDEEVYKLLWNTFRDDQSLNDELLCLDVGCSNTTLGYLRDLVEELGMRVTLIDHHPFDSPTSGDEYKTDNLRIVQDETHCTASLAYKVFSMVNQLKSDWAGFWTIVGIYGDMAVEKAGASKVLDSLLPKYPAMLPHRDPALTIEEKLTKKLSEQRWKHQPALMISRAMNMARRLTYHDGARLCLNACREVEEANDPFLLVRDLKGYWEWAKYPNVALVRRLVKRYIDTLIRDKLSLRTLDLGPIAVGIVSSYADIGGILANDVSDELGKPAYVLNDKLPNGMYKLSGRGEGIDHNAVFKMCDQLTGGRIKGGGHVGASSGTFAPIPFYEVCQIVRNAACKVIEAQSPKE